MTTKLSPETRQALIDVLNAQSGVARMELTAYKKAVAIAAPFMNTKEGKFTGGIQKDVYAANKADTELVAAAQAHFTKAKERAGKVAIKPPEENEAEPKIEITLSDKARTSDAIREKKRRVSPEIYNACVPNHVNKKGEILDKELTGKESLEEIREWCNENLPTGAPCGGGGYEIYKGEIHNDDTEGGHELSLRIRVTKTGLTLLMDEKETELTFPIKASAALQAIDPEIAALLTYEKAKSETPEVHVYDVTYQQRNTPAKAGAKFLYGENVWISFGKILPGLEKHLATNPPTASRLLLSAVQDPRNTEVARKLLKSVPEGEVDPSTPHYCARYNPTFLKELLTSRPDIPRTREYLREMVQRVTQDTLPALKDSFEILGKPDASEATNLLYAAAEEYKTYYGPTDERWRTAREIAVARQELGKFLLGLGANPHEAMEMGKNADRWEEGDDIADHDMDGEYEEFLSDMIDISEGKPAKQFPAYILTKKKAEPDMPEMA